MTKNSRQKFKYLKYLYIKQIFSECESPTLTLSGASGAYLIPSENNSSTSLNISTNIEYGGYNNQYLLDLQRD